MSRPALADACALIAFLGDGQATFSTTGLVAMKAPPLVSPITVWEISRKLTLGRLRMLPIMEHGLGSLLADQGFTIHPLTWKDAERANALPPIHKDPMDRMLIAQALNADLAVITDDGLFAAYGVAILW